MKKIFHAKKYHILFSIIVSIICFTLLFVTSISWNNSDKYYWIDDSLRHLKYSQLYDNYSKTEINENFSWWQIIQNSILTDYKTDLWEWHHIFLNLLSKTWITDINLLKLYYSLIFWFFIYIILYFWLRNKLWYSISLFILFFFLLSPDFLGRILLARPFWFTAILFTLITTSLLSKKYYYLIPLLIIGTYYHMLFYVLFILIFLYSLLIFKNDRKLWLKITGFSFLWSIIWLLFHYNPIHYLALSSITFFYIPIVHKINWVMASELNNTWPLFLYSIILFLWLISYYCIIQYNKLKYIKLNTSLVFIILLIWSLGVFSLIVNRFLDFYYPVFFIWIILIIKNIIKIDDFFSSKIKKFHNTNYSILLLMIVLLSIYWSTNKILTKNWFSIKKENEFIVDIKNIIPENSRVISYQLLNFPTLFYSLWEKYKYSSVMEPYYLYLKDKEKFKNFNDFFYFHYKKPEWDFIMDPSSILKDYWVNYLIFFWDNIYNNLINDYKSLYLLKDKIKEINNNENFKLIYKKWENKVWKVLY